MNKIVININIRIDTIIRVIDRFMISIIILIKICFH